MKLLRTLFACCFLFISVFVSAQNDNVSLQNRYRLAKSYEQAGDYDKAESLYAELLSIQPWNIQYVRSLNDLYLTQKKYNQSIELLQSRLNSNPNDISSYGLLGSTFYEMGQNDKAFETWDKALEINHGSINNYRIVANFAVENRAFEKAIEILLEGKKLSKDPHNFSYDLANLYSATLNFKAAVNEYCEILKAQPLQLQTIENRIANIFASNNDAVPIITTVKEWVNRENLQVHKELLAYLYISNDQYDEGLKTVKELENETDGKGRMLYNFAQEAFRNKEYASAAKAYELIINDFENSPFSAQAEIGYARTSEAAIEDELNALRENWKPILPVDTTDSYKFLPVIKAYQKIADKYMPNSVGNEALYRTGLIKLEKTNDIDSAEEIFLRLDKNAPLSVQGVRAKEKLGEIYIQKRMLEKAKQYFKSVANSSRGLAESERYSEFMIGKIEFWEKNFSEAVKKFSGIISNLSDDFANDAIEISAIVNTARSDSINLEKYAEADLLTYQNKLDLAASVYNEICEAENSPVLSKFAEYKYAEILVALDQFSLAETVLKKIVNEERGRIFSDKSAYLLANLYYYGLREYDKAATEYQNLLENYPNSLYLDQSRQMLNMLQTRKSEKI